MKRAIIDITSVFVIGTFWAFSFSLFLLANLWKTNYDDFQFNLTYFSWVCFTVALIASIRVKYRWAGRMLIIGILANIAVFAWSPFRDSGREADRIQRIVNNNQVYIDNAISIAACNNGTKAILSKFKRPRSNHKALDVVSIVIAGEDQKKPYKSLISTSGERRPNREAYHNYVKGRQIECANPDYPSLDSMLEVVIYHYYQNRPNVYPDDPLYTNEPLANQGIPIDPLDLEDQVNDLNRSSRARQEKIQLYKFLTTERNYKENDDGSLISEEHTTVLGNTNQVVVRVFKILCQYANHLTRFAC